MRAKHFLSYHMFHSHLLVIFDKLLYRKSEPKLPDSMDDESLANALSDYKYFVEKITTIREELQKRGTINYAQVELR